MSEPTKVAAIFDALHSWRLDAGLTGGQDAALLHFLVSLRIAVEDGDSTLTARAVRAEEAEALLRDAANEYDALVADTERLDWLEAQGDVFVSRETGKWWKVNPLSMMWGREDDEPLREAIDRASAPRPATP